jgi:hypothetical protein
MGFRTAGFYQAAGGARFFEVLFYNRVGVAADEVR